MKKIFLILFGLIAALTLKAQSPDSLPTPADRYLKQVAIDGILRAYTPWETAETQGKLKMPGLPISPTLKIFMRRGEELRLSARAPFIGEAFRIELNRDSILLINKMKRTYCCESTEQLSRIAPAGIEDIQNILLGRIVLPGIGVLDSINAPDVNFFPTDNGGWMAMANDSVKIEGVQFGYLVNADGTTAGWVMTPDSSDDYIQGTYSYGSKTRIDITAYFKEKTTEVTLELDPIKFGTEGFAPMELTDRYTQLSIKDFFNSIRL